MVFCTLKYAFVVVSYMKKYFKEFSFKFFILDFVVLFLLDFFFLYVYKGFGNIRHMAVMEHTIINYCLWVISYLIADIYRRNWMFAYLHDYFYMGVCLLVSTSIHIICNHEIDFIYHIPSALIILIYVLFFVSCMLTRMFYVSFRKFKMSGTGFRTYIRELIDKSKKEKKASSRIYKMVLGKDTYESKDIEDLMQVANSHGYLFKSIDSDESSNITYISVVLPNNTDKSFEEEYRKQNNEDISFF